LSEKDEVVPRSMGEEIWDASGGSHECGDHRSSHDSRRGFVSDATIGAGSNPGPRLVGRGKMVVVRNALHDTAWQHRQWVKEMAAYIDAVDGTTGLNK